MIQVGNARSATEPTNGVVSTRGHFDVGWDGAYRRDGVGPSEYETNGAVPGVDRGCASDVTVLIHGYGMDKADFGGKVTQLRTGLREEGYDGTIVGYSWDSDQPLVQWWDTTQIATWNGPKLAAFTQACQNVCPGGRIRYVAHSLGARVALAALESLAEAGATELVDSVSLLGAAEGAKQASLDGEYGAAIETSARSVENFWNSGDTILDTVYGIAEWEDALGCDGITGPAPANYADRNVDYVPDHFSYYEPDGGCLSDVVETW
jgi:pimeloyl-ACP methyl ester carboxylesterase